jgi:hypothetical protein
MEVFSVTAGLDCSEDVSSVFTDVLLGTAFSTRRLGFRVSLGTFGGSGGNVGVSPSFFSLPLLINTPPLLHAYLQPPPHEVAITLTRQHVITLSVFKFVPCLWPGMCLVTV